MQTKCDTNVLNKAVINLQKHMRIKISLKTQNMAGLFEVNKKKSECLIKPNWS